MNQLQKEKKIKRIIWILSIVIPIAVAALFKVELKGYDLSFLPPIYATINGVTAILLIAALIAVKNKKLKLHENIIKTALGCSVLFLLMYVAYHITSETTLYGDINHNGLVSENEKQYIKGSIGVYYFILISHIVLSVVVIPLVLFTYLRARLKNFEAHKKIARYTFPLWLYVAISGVIVYFMISPFYK